MTSNNKKPDTYICLPAKDAVVSLPVAAWQLILVLEIRIV